MWCSVRLGHATIHRPGEMHTDVAPEMITCVRMVKPNHYRLGPTLSVRKIGAHAISLF